jgi:hypothetical protein
VLFVSTFPICELNWVWKMAFIALRNWKLAYAHEGNCPSSEEESNRIHITHGRDDKTTNHLPPFLDACQCMSLPFASPTTQLQLGDGWSLATASDSDGMAPCGDFRNCVLILSLASQAMRHLLSPFPVVLVSIKNNKKLHSSNILARNVVAVEVKALAKPPSWPNWSSLKLIM